MAEKKTYSGDYRKTDTYKKADKKTRERIEQYRKENRVDNAQMYLLLLREDYRSIPKEEKQKGNRVAEILVLSGIVSFLIMTAREMKDLLPFAAIYMFIVAGIYFSGILNPYSRQLSNVNKQLKKMKQVPDLKEYLQPEQAK